MAPQTEPLRFSSRFQKWLAALCLFAVVILGPKPRVIAQDLMHLSGGQDTWGFAGRQLAIPADLADRARFCITISQNGIHVSSGTWNSFGLISVAGGVTQSTHGNQNCIEQYDLNGSFVRSWETNTSSEGSYLSGLASDSDGNIYAFDGFLGTVSKFTSTGIAAESWGAKGTGDGQFGYAGPSGDFWSTGPTSLMAVDSRKNVYVADVGNQRIQVFDSNGNFLRKFGSSGTSIEQFRTGPMAILVSSDDKLLVYESFTSTVNDSSSPNHSVMQFDSDGNFINRVSTNLVSTPWASANLVYSPSVITSYVNSNSTRVVSTPVVSTSYISSPLIGGPSYVYAFPYDTYSIFTKTPDGHLIIGNNQEGIFGYHSKTLARIFNAKEKKPSSLAPNNPAAVSTVRTVSAACDAQGNLWMIRSGRVECLERQMRFDMHKPSKAVPLPSVLNVSQASGSKVVDIDFLVLDSDSSTVDIGLVALVGGTRSWSNLVIPKKFTAMSPASGATGFSGSLTSGTLASGALASSVSTGKPYRVSWNAGEDMPGTNFASLSFGVIARDNRPEIGVHYVTIPAESGAAAFKISSKPVQENDLSDLWMWLVARGDSRVAVSGNKVILTAAGQFYISGAPLPNPSPVSYNSLNGGLAVQILYDSLSGEYTVGTPFTNGVAHDGTSTTVQGRAFAYKLINCRPVSPAEKVRAQAGRFNLNSVTDNSVVSLAP